MLLLIQFLACHEYTIENKDPATPEPAILDSGFVEEPEEQPEVSVTIPVPTASATIYANTSGELYEVDPQNGTIELIGAFQDESGPVDHFEDIAIDLSGHMYGGTGTYLYLINPENAQVFPICELEMRTTALTFTDTGDLIIGSENTLQILDIEDCSLQSLIPHSFYETSGDIVGLPDGYLYWTVYGEFSDVLVKVDPLTGQEQEIGPVNGERLYGVGYANEQLYGFAANGDIIRISPVEGQSVITARNDSLSWWGATTNPVVWE